jgi:hypothetical protein
MLLFDMSFIILLLLAALQWRHCSGGTAVLKGLCRTLINVPVVLAAAARSLGHMQARGTCVRALPQNWGCWFWYVQAPEGLAAFCCPGWELRLRWPAFWHLSMQNVHVSCSIVAGVFNQLQVARYGGLKLLLCL